MPTQPVIHVSAIRKTYGRTVAVDEVSFEVHQGEIFGLIGSIIKTAMDLILAVIQTVTAIIKFVWDNWGAQIMNVISAEKDRITSLENQIRNMATSRLILLLFAAAGWLVAIAVALIVLMRR